MYQEITALFYDDIDHRHLIASGRYYPEENGGWLDGKRSEPYEPPRIELVDITDEDGGEVEWGPVEHEARKALWEEAEPYTVEDW